MSNENQASYKVIVVGDGDVGKTALFFRSSNDSFTGDYEKVIGVNYHIKTIDINTKEGPIKVKLQLWDTGGLEKFTSIRPMYYRDSLGAVLVFDLTNSSSFEHIPQWIEDVRYNVKSEIPLLLVGNKRDLIDQRKVTLEDINSLTRDFNLYYMETSAKTGEGVDDCFYTLACLILGLELPKRSINTDKDFNPLSSQLGIPGTNFRIQFGKINGKWASRLLKGNSVIDLSIYKDDDLSASGFPNQNLIVGWVLRAVAIPNINPHQIMKTVHALTKQAGKRLIKNRNQDDDDDDRFPYPYIFKPPKPPDDFAMASQVQVHTPLKIKDPVGQKFCQYCGRELTKEEQLTHSCKKKPE